MGVGRVGVGRVSSAIPYLIPENMTLEQLHAKVRGCEGWKWGVWGVGV